MGSQKKKICAYTNLGLIMSEALLASNGHLKPLLQYQKNIWKCGSPQDILFNAWTLFS